MEQYAEKNGYQDENSVIVMARLRSRCCGLKKYETETRIEVKPLGDPASHDRPEKKDDISQKKQVRHKESCSGVRTSIYATVPWTASETLGLLE